MEDALATATATDKKGMKRICPSCSTRYYDFNKRPVICPNCKTEFTGEIKLKARRRSAANDVDEGQVSLATASDRTAGGDEEEEDLAETEEGVVSLEDLDEDEDLEGDEDDTDLEIEDDLETDDDLGEEDDDLDEDEEEDLDDDEDGGKKSRKKK